MAGNQRGIRVIRPLPSDTNPLHIHLDMQRETMGINKTCGA